MKLGLTGTTRRTEHAADGAEHPPQSTVRRGRKDKGGLRSDIRPMSTTPSTPPPRKERNALETKRRILEAAESEFAAKGFDGARLGTIARAAAVQQALIHHYFHDKEGLHGEVVRNGLTAMTEGVWQLLSRMDAPPKKTTKAKTKSQSKDELRLLAEAFVDLLLRFFATNGSFLAILRHESRRNGDGAAKIVHGSVGPIFDGIVGRLDAMRARGVVKKDVDARHLVLSCVAMVAFPFQEEPFVGAIWPADWHGRAFLEERKKHIVEMILARVAP
ncbi:MAG TPA: TetR family transcriptional regulator [Labilithrix sp.]|nr:TetR family transcriptional regulator [Labilithrix sp.]